MREKDDRMREKDYDVTTIVSNVMNEHQIAPVYNVQTVHIFQGESDLSRIELGPIFGETSHFPEVEEELPTATVVQNKK